MKKYLILITFLGFWASISSQAQIPVIEKLKWINFSPYVESWQNPNKLTQIPESQIVALIDSLLPYTEGIRTFGTMYGLERAPYIAKQKGLKVIVGIWLGIEPRDTLSNRLQIESGIKIAKDGMADKLIVGSEVLLRNDLPVERLLEYINKVKTSCPGIPVSCADVPAKIINNPSLIDACDFVAVNIYPFWEGVSIDCAIKSFNQSYLMVKSMAKGKEVFISETGWKTEGNVLGEAIPSLNNSVRYLREALNWSKATGVQVNLFCAFDEPWKLPNDGGWGIFKSDKTLKPGMEAIVAPIIKIDTTWLCSKLSNAGNDTLSIDYIPVIGSHINIFGHANHINPCDYRVAAYIRVSYNGWYNKPTWENPSVALDCHGKWNLDYTTGTNDRFARDICLFLIPAGYTPQLVGGSSTIPSDIYKNAISWKCFHRDTLHTAKLTASADSICLGSEITLTAVGGTKYLWNTGDTSSHIISKPVNSRKNSYTVEISDGNGIGQLLQKDIYVIEKPLYLENVVQVICPGDTAILSVHPSALPDFIDFKWNTGQKTPSIMVSPDSTTNYDLSGTTREGCQSNAWAVIYVSKADKEQTGAWPRTICYGNSSDLYVYGGKSYKWSTGDTTDQIRVTPETTQIYSVRLINNLGCEFVLYDTVFVLPQPILSAQPDSVLKGNSSVLTAWGGEEVSYLWSTGSTAPSITVTPEETKTYTVQITNEKYWCSHTLTKTITVLKTVSSEGISNSPDFEIYPNPANNVLKIACSCNFPVTGSVESMTGVRLLTFSFTGITEINTQSLIPGNYIVELRREGQVYREKVVISK